MPIDSPSSVKRTGVVNIYEQMFCIQCDQMILVCNRCNDPNKCSNYIKAEFLKEEEDK